VLEALGLSELEERVYVALVSGTATTADELTGLGPASIEDIQEALVSLEGHGMVRFSAGADRELIPAPPHLAGEALVLRRAEELARVRLQLLELTDAYRYGSRERQAGEVIEVLSGTAAIQRCFEEIQRLAVEDLIGFCQPPYVVPGDQNETELAMLERGVQYRSVYERTALEMDGAPVEVARYIAAGEQARVINKVPIKLAVVDRRYALVPIASGRPGADAAAVLIHGSSMLDALVALFEELWAKATPLQLTEAGVVEATSTGPFSVEDARLISLLLAGLPDKAVASHLGISLRSLQRKVKQLMDSTGVTTRMQLGWHVGTRSLL
jgi:hypothetical protein